MTGVDPGLSDESDRILEGGRVLIVEDQLIIAMEAEAVLQSLGAGECLIAVTMEVALRLLVTHELEFALLDINLGGSETSEPIAARLRELGVPFVVASGYREAADGLLALKGAPVVTKPYTAAQLRAAIAVSLRKHP